jgi:iron complex transport system substrate-binding protein
VAVSLVLTASLTPGCQEAPPIVEQPARPAQRIVSLAPHITELVFAAGAGDKLVGVVDYSDFPAQARLLPKIGDSFRVDYEEIALSDPDLILTWESGTPREVSERLQTLGYRVVELEPDSIEDIVAELERVGELAGTAEIAAERASIMRMEIAALRARYAGGEALTVFFQVSAEPLFTVAGAHVINEILELCGGRNIFAGLPGIAPPVSTESVLAAAPDVILATVQDDDETWMQSWTVWHQLPAVAAGNLYSVDRDLITRSGPRIIEGMRQVCEALARARNSSEVN